MTDGGERSEPMLTTVDDYSAADETGAVQWRCHHCRRLLAVIAIRCGWVEVRCKCGTVNVLQAVETTINSQPGHPAL